MGTRQATLTRLLCVLALVAPLLMHWSNDAFAGKARPGQVLKGKRFKLKIIKGSFTLPKGWSAKETEDGIHLSNSRFANATITLGVIALNPEQQAMRIDGLVWQVARNALGQMQMTQLRAPVPSRARSKPVAHLILQGPVNGVAYRARVGAIRLGSQAMLFIAVYPAMDELAIGAVFDTTMVSFRGRETLPKTVAVAQPPAPAPAPSVRAPATTATPSNINRKLTKQLLGCWRYRTSTGGSTGSSHSTKYFRFDEDGNYTYTYRLVVSTPYGSSRDGDDDEGRYFVVGKTIDFKSNRGSEQDVSTSVRVKSGFLFVGNTRYIPCS